MLCSVLWVRFQMHYVDYSEGKLSIAIFFVTVENAETQYNLSSRNGTFTPNS